MVRVSWTARTWTAWFSVILDGEEVLPYREVSWGGENQQLRVASIYFVFRDSLKRWF